MAFNPFHRFRKHQRTVMAVMAIVCMFLFIFGSFGRGDMIERLQGWLGMRGNRGTDILLPDGQPLKLYGQTFTTADLEDLAMRRRMASDFLVHVTNTAHRQLTEKDGFKDLSSLPQVSMIIESRAKREQEFRMDQFFIQRKLRGPFTMEEIRSKYEYPMFQALADLDRILAARATGEIGGEGIPYNALSDRARRLTELRGVLRQDINLFYANPDIFYFGGTIEPASLIDFKLWLHQADALQIQISDNALLKAIKDEALERDVIESFEDSGVKAFLAGAGYPNQTPSTLKQALKDEFRAMMAQTAILGEEPGVREFRSSDKLVERFGGDLMRRLPRERGAVLSPAQLTPEEFFQFYLRERTTVNVGILPINVDDYLSKVEGTPSEEELERLFKKFRTTEPNEDSNTPGFKEPAHFRIAWIKGTAADERYQAKARLILAKPTVQATTAALQSLIPIGSGPVGTATALAQAFGDDGYEPTLLNEYRNLVFKERRQGEAVAAHLLGTKAPDAANLYRAGTLTFTLGQLATATNLGNSFAAPVSAIGTAGIYSRGDRADGPVVAAYVASAGPQVLYPSLTLGSIGPMWLLPYAGPPAFTAKLYKERLEERVLPQMADNLLNRDMGEFSRDLQLIRNASKTELDAKARELAAKYGFTYGVMDKGHSRFDLDQDPGIKPFKDAFTKAQDVKPAFAGTKQPEFTAFLLANPDAARGGQGVVMFHLNQWTNEVRRSFNETPTGKAEYYGSWIFEVEAPREPDSLNDPGVRERVKAAWKKQRARELARKDADRILEGFKKQPQTGMQAASELRARNPEAYVELNGVARLIPDLQTVSVQRTYTPYTIPDRVIARPTSNTVDEFLSLKREGDVVIVRDRPEEHYYVTVLLLRTPNLDDPTARPDELARARAVALEDWRQVYEQSALTFMEGNQLWKFDLAKQQDRHRNRVLAMLRAEAAGGDKQLIDGRFVLPDSLQVRRNSSRGSSEPPPMDFDF